MVDNAAYQITTERPMVGTPRTVCQNSSSGPHEAVGAVQTWPSTATVFVSTTAGHGMAQPSTMAWAAGAVAHAADHGGSEERRRPRRSDPRTMPPPRPP
jgi:hypothetical protein